MIFHPISAKRAETSASVIRRGEGPLVDLQALPGIGPKLAQRVIDHRTARGPFGKIEDLQQVKGIGRKKFDRLRPHVLVTNTRSLARHKGTL